MDADVRALMALARASVTKVDHAIPLVPEQNLLRHLTDWFASSAAVSATELPDDLVDLLVASGIKRDVAVAVGKMVLAKSMSGRTRHGAPTPQVQMPAMRRVASEEPHMRALYVLAASKRLTAAQEDGDYSRALVRERRYLDMHVAAGRGRRAAAKKVDDLRSPLLIWRTQEDDRVDPRCAVLDRRLFTVDNPPDGVYPGAAHSRCRCYAEVWGSPLFQP